MSKEKLRVYVNIAYTQKIKTIMSPEKQWLEDKPFILE